MNGVNQSETTNYAFCMSKADQTRQKIIEKAAPLFNKQGYAGTSVQDVMEATGLSKGCIYGNFADKDALALAAFEHNWYNISSRVREEWHRQSTGMGKLMVFANFYRTNYPAVFAQGGCPVLNLSTEADDGNVVLREKVVHVMHDVLELLEMSIVWGKKSGEFKPGIEARKYAGILFALTEGGILLAKTLGEPAYLFHAVDQFEYIIRHELVVKKSVGKNNTK